MKKNLKLKKKIAIFVALLFLMPMSLMAKGSSSILGDVNGDGYVNVTDVTLLVNNLLGFENASFVAANADLNGDNDITVTDVTALVNLILNGSSKISNVVVTGADGFTFGGEGNGIAFSRAYMK